MGAGRLFARAAASRVLRFCGGSARSAYRSPAGAGQEPYSDPKRSSRCPARSFAGSLSISPLTSANPSLGGYFQLPLSVGPCQYFLRKAEGDSAPVRFQVNAADVIRAAATAGQVVRSAGSLVPGSPVSTCPASLRR